VGTLVDLFGWPNGSVLTNLIASLIWGMPAAGLAVWRARVHLRRLHGRHDAHEQAVAALHAEVKVLRQERVATMPPVDYRKLLDEVERQKRRNGHGGL